MARWAGMIVAACLLLGNPLAAAQALAAGPIINVDGPGDSSVLKNNVDVLGWAVDRAARQGTGIDAVHVYLDGIAGKGRFLGSADYGLVRTDVAQALGQQRFAPSGFKYPFDVAKLVPGEHQLYVYARSVNVGWKHIQIKIVVEITESVAPAATRPVNGFLAPPPGLPVAGQTYTYSYGQTPPPPPAPGLAPPPPPSGVPALASGSNPYAAPPSAAWAIAHQMSRVGDTSLAWDDCLYLGVGESSGANLYALLLSAGSVGAWHAQSWEARYDWALQTARQFAAYHQGQPAAFMLMHVTIEGQPAPAESKWTVTLGAGPHPGSFQVAQVLAFGMHRPGQGYQIDIRTY